MSASERREVRKQARINKAASKVPVQRFVQKTDRQIREDVEKREEEFKQTNLDRGPVQTPEQQAAATVSNDQTFEEMFLSIAQFLPPEDQARAYSLFSVFRKLPLADQKATVDSLMEVARQSAGPLFNLYEKRIKEDTTYNKGALERQMNNALSNYDRLISTIDTNVIRDKAKTDRGMAETIRSITNRAFVDRVSGSGIQRRRTQEELERARLDKEDADVRAGQGRGAAGAQFEQLKANLQSQLDREDVLQERSVFDNEQKQLEEERMLFLKLFENQMSGMGDDARANLETGDIPSADGKRSTTAAEAMAQGGTDEQRRARTAEEKRVANARAEDARYASTKQNVDLAIERVFDLNNYRASLRLANRDTSAVDAEIARLSPVAEAQLERARRGEGTFMRQIGSGLPDLGGLLSNAANEYTRKMGGLYGAPIDRSKLTQELQRYSSMYTPESFGTEFVGLDKDAQSMTSRFINPFGSTTGNQDVLAPTQNTAPAPSVTPATARTTVTPITRAPSKPIVKPTSQYPTVDLKNRTYTGSKPSFRRS